MDNNNDGKQQKYLLLKLTVASSSCSSEYVCSSYPNLKLVHKLRYFCDLVTFLPFRFERCSLLLLILLLSKRSFPIEWPPLISCHRRMKSVSSAANDGRRLQSHHQHDTKANTQFPQNYNLFYKTFQYYNTLIK